MFTNRALRRLILPLIAEQILTMLVGMAKIQTMPVAMYGIVLDSSAVQIGAVFAILLIIPSAVLIFLMRKYIGPEAIAGGFKMK